MTSQSARFDRASARKSEDISKDAVMKTDQTPTPADVERLADYFAIVGLPEDLKPLDNGCEPIRTVEKVEIVIMEKWEVSEIKK